MNDRLRRLLAACWAGPLFANAYPAAAPGPDDIATLEAVSDRVAVRWGDLLPKITPEASPEAIARRIDKIARGSIALWTSISVEITDLEPLSALGSFIGLLYVVDWLMDADDGDMRRALEAFLGSDEIQAALQNTQTGASLIPPAVYAHGAIRQVPGPSAAPLTPSEHSRLLALTDMYDSIVKSTLPEDHPWLLGSPFLGILVMASMSSELSLEYLGTDEEAYWHERAKALTYASINSTAILPFTATAYAIYRTQDPALPPLSAIYQHPALRDDLGPLMNAAVRVYDDYTDRGVDREHATFALNIFNNPHPEFVQEFLHQAGITDEETRYAFISALRSGTDSDALSIVNIFKDLKRDRFETVSKQVPAEYRQYMTLLARMLENTYAARFVK